MWTAVVILEISQLNNNCKKFAKGTLAGKRASEASQMLGADYGTTWRERISLRSLLVTKCREYSYTASI